MTSASTLPRSEYPRPQFERDEWMCLNGEWQFEIDGGDSGLERGMRDRELAARILVPFCPESELSGIGHTDFMAAVWYRRDVDIPVEWQGRKVLLHFQAVDYDTTVWVNSTEVAQHRGGFTPITADLDGIAEAGTTATIVVRARDIKDMPKPRGKQSPRYGNEGCTYTRTTGIWQTVWMEPVPYVHLKRARITPDMAAGSIRIVQPMTASRPGTRLRASLRDEAGEITTVEVPADADFTPTLELVIPKERQRLWAPGEGNLYDLVIELLDASGRVADTVRSYAALRGVAIDGMAVKINGRPVFQRLVLDQGYYPDGIMTAPSDGALQRDIELSLAVGFNGARLHQKIFEERFLYHADRTGYLVWGEFPDWGIDRGSPQATEITQWLEVLERDYSHPSIVGWCALNETGLPMGKDTRPLADLTRGTFLAAKAMDQSRPVLDASGWIHLVRESDIGDGHEYEQDPQTFKEKLCGLAKGEPQWKCGERAVPYGGQPYFVSEFGGIWWKPGAGEDGSWGYGVRPKSVKEYCERFTGLCKALLDDPRMFGYCYTQLTDVFQEQNGIYNFDRSEKFDLGPIRSAQLHEAAIELKVADDIA